MGLFNWMQTEKPSLESARKDFPILFQFINNKPLVYLDSAATSLTPNQVVNAISDYYKKYNANVHRGVHQLSEKATKEYESARKRIAEYIDADFNEIIYTRGTTEALNLLAYSLTKHYRRGDEIVISQMEHHSNLIPWRELADERGLILKYIKVRADGSLDMDHAKECITEKTKVVSVAHISNVLGTVNDIKALAELAHSKNAVLVVDGAQAIPHMTVSVTDLDCDFYAFSGHKMLGPTGIGILYGKKALLEQMSPFMYGGDMIKEVTFYRSKWNDVPWKFEAGTPNIAGAIGLGAAVDYIKKIGMANIEAHTKELMQYTFEKLNEIEGLELYGQKQPNVSGVVPFNIKGVHPHDVLTILDSEGVAIRGGQLCAMPLVTEVLGQPAICRASLQFYNTKQDIDRLVLAIKKVKEVFA